MKTSQEIESAVEALIDSSSVGELLEAISQVCFAKAEHLAVNWQDQAGEMRWVRCGRYLDGMKTRKAVANVANG